SGSNVRTAKIPGSWADGDGFLKAPARMGITRFLMRETMFDESYNIREVLDDVIERVTLREKLIQTAKGFAEKKKEERYTLAIRQLDNLFNRIRTHNPGISGPGRDSFADVMSGMPKDLFPEEPTREAPGTKKTSSRS